MNSFSCKINVFVGLCPVEGVKGMTGEEAAGADGLGDEFGHFAPQPSAWNADCFLPISWPLCLVVAVRSSHRDRGGNDRIPFTVRNDIRRSGGGRRAC